MPVFKILHPGGGRHMRKQVAPQKDVFLRPEHVQDSFFVTGFLFVIRGVCGELVDQGFTHVDFLSGFLFRCLLAFAGNHSQLYYGYNIITKILDQ